ncbi:MAG: RDD family protein, partial [Candidatus Aminicenantes bacterium]|nr:RDD family protein [Candidatus Aminicenantes bacterium]
LQTLRKERRGRKPDVPETGTGLPPWAKQIQEEEQADAGLEDEPFLAPEIIEEGFKDLEEDVDIPIPDIVGLEEEPEPPDEEEPEPPDEEEPEPPDEVESGTGMAWDADERELLEPDMGPPSEPGEGDLKSPDEPEDGFIKFRDKSGEEDDESSEIEPRVEEAQADDMLFDMETPPVIEEREGEHEILSDESDWTVEEGADFSVEDEVEDVETAAMDKRERLFEMETSSGGGWLSRWIKARVVDVLLVGSVWFLALVLASFVLKKTVLQLIGSSAPTVLLFFGVLVSVYFYLFYFFLGSTLGDRLFPRKD